MCLIFHQYIWTLVFWPFVCLCVFLLLSFESFLYILSNFSPSLWLMFHFLFYRDTRGLGHGFVHIAMNPCTGFVFVYIARWSPQYVYLISLTIYSYTFFLIMKNLKFIFFNNFHMCNIVPLIIVTILYITSLWLIL